MNIINLPTDSTLETGLEQIRQKIVAWTNRIKAYFPSVTDVKSIEKELGGTLADINTELVDKGSTQADDYSEVAEKISDIQTGVTPIGTLFETETVTSSFTKAITATFYTTKGKKPFFFQLIRTQALDENAYGMISLSACQRIRNRNQYEGGGYAKRSDTGQTTYAPAVSNIPNNYNGYIGITENSISIHCINSNSSYFAGTYELVCYYLVDEGAEE